MKCQKKSGGSSDEHRRSKDDARRSEDDVRRSEDDVRRSKDDARRSKDDVRRSKDDVRRSEDDVLRSKDDARCSKDDARRSKDDVRRSKDDVRRSKDDVGSSKDDVRRSKDDARRSKDDVRRSKDDARRSKDDVRRSKDDVRRSKDDVRRSKDDVRRSKDDERRSKDDVRRSKDDVRGRGDSRPDRQWKAVEGSTALKKLAQVTLSTIKAHYPSLENSRCLRAGIRESVFSGMTGDDFNWWTESVVRRAPKVLLHEHLDGGLRPQTVIDLAAELQYNGLPTHDADALRVWFHRGANRGSLPLYLEGFAHTCGVMQTAEAIERVAFEFIEDMHDDGVVYAEARFAPCFHTERGLSGEAVVQAALNGLRRGGEKYAVSWGLIICAMRHRTDALEAAELAINFRSRGVVGFDLAGEEAGYPPKKHAEAFQAIQRANFYSTLHAGEAFGTASIWQALQLCGAHRLGHATRLTEDMTIEGGRILKLGSLAQYILDRRIPLELCLSSNVHTGAVRTLEEHPFPLFFKRGFRVTLNTDDRLMSDTTMTKEFLIAGRQFGITPDDMEKLTINAIKSAFIAFDERLRLIYEVIKPRYAALRRELAAG